MRWFLGSVALFVFAGLVVAQCPGGRCAVPAYTVPMYTVPVYTVPVYEWQPFKNGNVDYVKLTRNGVQCGAWSIAEQKYYALNGDDFVVATPPIAPPEPVVQAMPTGANFDKIQDGRYTVKGQEVTRDEAIQVIRDSKIPDDSKKLRLTFIGSDADCKKALDALVGVPLDNLVIKCYPPDHPQIKGYGWVTTGTPSVYLQSPIGKVIHTQKDITDLAKAVNAGIRKPDPNYDDTKAPDLRVSPSPPTPPSPAIPSIPPVVWVGAAIVGMVILRKVKT